MVVAYIANKALYDKLPTAVNSLLSNNQEVDKIYLLIEDDEIPYINSQKIKFINLSKRNDIVKSGINCTKRYPYTTMARCFLPSIIRENKILYLDVDTTVNASIKELWNVSLGANYAAARFETEDYFNSGVLLMNLQLIKGCEKKLHDLLKNCKFAFPDQDAMNIVFKNRVAKLPDKYNVLGRSDVYKTHEIAIRHYAGLIKPWKDTAAKQDIAFWNKYKCNAIN